MAHRRRASTSGQDSLVHLHLQEKDDSHRQVLDWEDRWFERGVQEANYVYLGWPTLNTWGEQHLSATNNAPLRTLPRRCNHSSHLFIRVTNDSHGSEPVHTLRELQSEPTKLPPGAGLSVRISIQKQTVWTRSLVFGCSEYENHLKWPKQAR